MLMQPAEIIAQLTVVGNIPRSCVVEMAEASAGHAHLDRRTEKMAGEIGFRRMMHR